MLIDHVKCWSEQITIPTYRIGEPDKNPMFLEKRVYQGSSGVVYPYPVIERVFDEKYDKEYTAVYLENRYLKIMVLPEIDGRQWTLITWVQSCTGSCSHGKQWPRQRYEVKGGSDAFRSD